MGTKKFRWMAIVAAVAAVALGVVVLVEWLLPQDAVFKVRSMEYRAAMQTIGSAVDHYRRLHGGEIPTMEQIVQQHKQDLERFGWPCEEWTERFGIMAIPGCVFENGCAEDAYVIIARKPPKNIVAWRWVLVGRNFVEVD